MKTLSIHLEHCFGISHFEHIFDFSTHNCALLYAPNGMMKTSFAETFRTIGKGESPHDRIFPDREPVVNILCDSNPIDPQTIFVSDAESDIATEHNITTFLASQGLKKQYDIIYQELEKVKKDFLVKLKDVSKSSDCEQELISTFQTKENQTFFSCILSIEKEILTPKPSYKFKYNDVFDKKGAVKKFVEKHKELIQQYFTNYQTLLTQSEFFSSNENGNSFGTYQASILQKSVADEAFFSAKHKIILHSGKEITSSQQLQDMIDEEIQKVINDVSLKSTFKQIDTAIGNNNELRAFKQVLQKDNSLIPLLMDYDNFKKQVWYGFIHRLVNEASDLINAYKSKAQDLEDIIHKAQEESNAWKQIIDLYNKRFHVPFNVEIKNKADIILKQETANLLFTYKDAFSEAPVIQSKENLLGHILSKGERRAFHILQILFEIEARKLSSEDSLLILDDIADSFDYKNKYAIIEYLADLCKIEKFKMILLTHNFDFYRTVASRMGLSNSVFMAVRDEKGHITCATGQYRKDAFHSLSQRANERKTFISLLPFARNIIGYLHGTKSEEYNILTHCLHLKKDSHLITANQICDIYKTHIHNCNNLNVDFGSKPIIELIINTADIIEKTKPIDEILLENKLVLSIAIRLQSERLILHRINSIDTTKIKSNQTRELINIYKNFNHPESAILSILERVNLMTPENIHANSFMYEPLIDMSMLHLLNLYRDIKKQLNA